MTLTITIPTASSSPSQTFAQVVALLPAPSSSRFIADASHVALLITGI